ncbi:glycosyltransferase [Pseudarthrobacter sp. PS3-L1]|nr:glycosyltransferase [Pseudarthrobacter sp. PS3-L1]
MIHNAIVRDGEQTSGAQNRKVPTSSHHVPNSVLLIEAGTNSAPEPAAGSLRIAVLAHLHHPIASPFAGGMESHTAHLITGLLGRGHEVTLFSKEGSVVGAPVVPVLEAGFLVQGYPEDERTNHQHDILDQAMELAVRTVGEGSFDVVINNSLSPIPHRFQLEVPTLHIFHTPPLPRLIEILQHNGGRVSDHLNRYVTVSQANAVPWRSCVPEIGVVHNGIDLHQWHHLSEPQKGVAAWTGRIASEKGTHVAIQAAREASLKLRIAGPIHDREYFRTMIEPHLDKDITYLGHLDQPNLQHMIASAEVFLSSPLWEEPFGLTTLESMACGTPVAALPSGAMEELIGTTGGVLARNRDSNALAVAALRARDMDRGQVFARAERFTLFEMIKGYEKILYSMVSDPLGPDAGKQ